jgi:DNA-binding MarR family transcriptional regulator
MKNLEISPIKKLLFSVIKLAKKDMEKRFRRAGVEISHLQYYVLVKLLPGSQTLKDVSKQLEVRPPSLIPVIDALEQGGYLKRQADLKDRRKTQLFITKSGIKLLKKVPNDEKADALNQAFNRLSLEKQKYLTSALEELIINFPK